MTDTHFDAEEHFKYCGPLCSHVTWCEHCMEVFGFCGRPGCDGRARWKKSVDPSDNPSIELGVE
jgi:hypothetical protein